MLNHCEFSLSGQGREVTYTLSNKQMWLYARYTGFLLKVYVLVIFNYMNERRLIKLRKETQITFE